MDVVGQAAKREEKGGERKGHVRHQQACISDVGAIQHSWLAALLPFSLGSGLCSEKDTLWWDGPGQCIPGLV